MKSKHYMQNNYTGDKNIKIIYTLKGYGKAMFEFKDYTKEQLIEYIIKLRNENKFLKELYKGTDEFKDIQDYIQ